MGTLIDLFSVLDGVDKDRFPNQVAISPAPAIRTAMLALCVSPILKQLSEDWRDRSSSRGF